MALTYKKVEVSEQQLEDLVRQYVGRIEEGLVYLDHQKSTATGGRLDVLMVDSGGAFVVAELKVTEDDGMLLQALDYYDYVAAHIEAFGRLFREQKPDPTQQVRLFLVAPGRIVLDAITYAVSMKVDGRVFAYFDPRRKHFMLSTYN